MDEQEPIRHPVARESLTRASDALARIERAQQELADRRRPMQDAVGSPLLAEVLGTFLDRAAGSMQEMVHRGRADLSRIAEQQRADERRHPGRDVEPENEE